MRWNKLHLNDVWRVELYSNIREKKLMWGWEVNDVLRSCNNNCRVCCWCHSQKNYSLQSRTIKYNKVKEKKNGQVNKLYHWLCLGTHRKLNQLGILLAFTGTEGSGRQEIIITNRQIDSKKKKSVKILFSVLRCSINYNLRCVVCSRRHHL